jgi:hypothetical protein
MTVVDAAAAARVGTAALAGAPPSFAIISSYREHAFARKSELPCLRPRYEVLGTPA